MSDADLLNEQCGQEVSERGHHELEPQPGRQGDELHYVVDGLKYLSGRNEEEAWYALCAHEVCAMNPSQKKRGQGGKGASADASRHYAPAEAPRAYRNFLWSVMAVQNGWPT